MFLCSQALEDNRFNLLLETIQEVINEDTMVQKGMLNMRTQKVFLVKVLLLTFLCQYCLLWTLTFSYGESIDLMSRICRWMFLQNSFAILPKDIAETRCRSSDVVVRMDRQTGLSPRQSLTT